MKTLPVVMLLLASLVPIAVAGDPSILVRFNGGIGVDPVAGISSGAPVSNIVCGVDPGGLPWRIQSLKAKVKTDGSIRVEGRGLLLAGGNSSIPLLDAIGTNGGQSVQAELFCNTSASDCGTPFTSEVVALSEDGDFRITGSLTPTPLPDTCTKPVLLIVSSSNGHWFAAGIPKVRGGE